MVLQYHSKDDYATPATEDRQKDYKFKGLPALIFDGKGLVLGGYSGSYKQQASTIDKELARGAAATISVNASFGTEITAAVTVTNTSAADITNARLMAVVYQDLGTDEHHFVVRDILPPVVFSLAAGAKQSYDFKSEYAGNNLNVVVFVQDASGDVLQAAEANRQA